MKPIKYKKHPVEIEAIKYTRERPADILDFVPEEKVFFSESMNEYYIETLEGNMYLTDGDYVIKGVNGEFYPCKPEIFEKTYEVVDATPPPKPHKWERVAEGDLFWWIDYDGSVNNYREDYQSGSNSRYTYDNYYHTKAEATYYRDLQQLQAEIRRWKWEHDKGTVDFKRGTTKYKYVVYYECCSDKLEIYPTVICQTIFTPYFSTRELAQECIDVFGSRIIDCIKKGRDFE